MSGMEATRFAEDDDRPLDVPTGWKWMRLGEILRLRKEVVHPYDKPEGVATFVGLEHIESMSGQRTGSREIDMAHMPGRKPRFYAGDIVYGYLRPYLNKVWVADFDGLCSVDQYVYSVAPDVADKNYIAWFMRSPAYLRRAPISTTPGQLPRIRIEEVASVPILLPSLSEQRKIATHLADQMTSAAAAHRAAGEGLNAARMLEPAHLDQFFHTSAIEDWPVRPLGDVGKVVSGITLGRRLNGTTTRSVPYLRVANVKDGRLDIDDIYRIEATDSEIQKLTLRYGDLLLTEGGDADKLGRGTFWDDQFPECIHQNHIFRVRFDLDRFCPRFLAAQFASPYGKSYFLAHAKQTTGIATINQRVLAAFPLLAPPIEVQRQVASMIEERMGQTVKLYRALTSQLHAIEAIPGSLLNQTFGPDEPRDSSARPSLPR